MNLDAQQISLLLYMSLSLQPVSLCVCCVSLKKEKKVKYVFYDIYLYK